MRGDDRIRTGGEGVADPRHSPRQTCDFSRVPSHIENCHPPYDHLIQLPPLFLAQINYIAVSAESQTYLNGGQNGISIRT